ncbi:non-homologous end-joining factor 1 isoform X1 [Syngnathus acus]|uniref:non-homologous end-joining factor 1 isoform X1 n=1 Tax=Syngnathus acus TaxID=161584 RepID=UPI0018861432|nr:non-homologous end-joining factor 1 isoform X1 [Syngnathus acus]XP_037099914.1 non-homologous end-joining factor 1 isoform X1 [Syngnathus acus]
METIQASSDVLLQHPWLPMAIDGCNLLVKSCFAETTYRILLTDMHCVWQETMQSAAIQSRAQELNKRLQAPVKAFFSHLCEVVRPCLSGSGQPSESQVGITVMRPEGGDLCLRLKSKLAELPFYWEFRCTPAPVAVVCLHLVQPLLSMSHVLQQQVEELEELLVTKDAEIQDYKENGATLSRARLQTDIFERHTYKVGFLAKTLAVVCSDDHGVKNFGDDLRELYTAIVAHGSKLSEQDQLVAADPDPATSSGPKNICVFGPRHHAGVEACAEGGEADDKQNRSSPVAEARDHIVHTAPAQQLITCGRAERTSSKAKKKKVVGLFR